jgi:hypothetical protein
MESAGTPVFALHSLTRSDWWNVSVSGALKRVEAVSMKSSTELLGAEVFLATTGIEPGTL